MKTTNLTDHIWSREAYEFLLNYIKSKDEFMTEEVRFSSKGIIDDPSDDRAWGGVITLAKKSGLIEKKGYKQKKGEKCHRAIATVWKVKQN